MGLCLTATAHGADLSEDNTDLADELSHVTSGFAKRIDPIKKNVRHHDGIDMGAPTGTPVHSVDAGVVEFAGVHKHGYGNVVFIQHSDRQTTVYAHLSRIDVVKGQGIAQGDLIGAVGATGRTTGPHLHFEVRQDGKQVDPLLSLRAGANPFSPSGRMRLAKAEGEFAPSSASPYASAADVPPSVRCVDLLLMASLETLHADDEAYFKKECNHVFH